MTSVLLAISVKVAPHVQHPVPWATTVHMLVWQLKRPSVALDSSAMKVHQYPTNQDVHLGITVLLVLAPRTLALQGHSLVPMAT